MSRSLFFLPRTCQWTFLNEFCMSRKRLQRNYSFTPTFPKVRFTPSCFKRESFLLFVFPHLNSSNLIVYLHFLYTPCLYLKLRIRIFNIVVCFFNKQRPVSLPKTYTIIECYISSNFSINNRHIVRLVQQSVLNHPICQLMSKFLFMALRPKMPLKKKASRFYRFLGS